MQAIVGDSSIIEYVELLLGEEVGKFVVESPEIFQRDKKLKVAICKTGQTSFVVYKKLRNEASQDCRISEFSYAVHSTDSRESESGYAISGTKLSPDAATPITFFSSIDFANYLKSESAAAKTTQDQEGRARFIRVVLSLFEEQQPTVNRLYLKRVGKDALFCTKDPQRLFSISEIKRDKSTRFEISGPAGGQNSNDRVIFHTVLAFISYLNFKYNPELEIPCQQE